MGRRPPRTPGSDSPPTRPSSSGTNTTEATTRTDKDKANKVDMAKILKCTANQDLSKSQRMCRGNNKHACSFQQQEPRWAQVKSQY